METIHEYLDTLASDIEELDLSNRSIERLPDLFRFINLKKLNISHNKLRYFFDLPSTIEYLDCSNNNLVILHTQLFCSVRLQYLDCSNNNLERLKNYMPINLKVLICHNNSLSSIGNLNNCIRKIDCSHNNLPVLPYLPKSLYELSCNNNNLRNLTNIPHNLRLLNCLNNPISSELELFFEPALKTYKFKHLFYSLKYKKKLRQILYEKIREPKIMKQYSPNNLKIMLDNNQNVDLEELINIW